MTRKFAAFLIILGIMLAPILALAMTLTGDEQTVCREHGGCVALTMDTLREKLREVFERGHEAGRISCGNRA